MKHDYDRIKQRLMNRKEEIERNLETNNEFGLEIGFASSRSSGELSQYDNHPADSGTALYEREKDVALRDMEHEELRDIHTALAKFENGTYGLDEGTGEAIPIERLEALPTATTTADHSPNQQISNRRPVEEDVLAEMETAYATNSQETEFNEQNAYHIVAEFNESDMTYDDSSNMDAEDGMGYVQLVEAIGATDINGYSGNDDVQFLRNIQYDQWMNQESTINDDENEEGS